VQLFGTKSASLAIQAAGGKTRSIACSVTPTSTIYLVTSSSCVVILCFVGDCDILLSVVRVSRGSNMAAMQSPIMMILHQAT